MTIRLTTATAVIALLFGTGGALRQRQADRPADRPYRLHCRRARYRSRQTGDRDVEERDRRRIRESMLRDHESVNKQALDLVKKLNVTPEDNDTEQDPLASGRGEAAGAAKLKGEEFDKAYIAHEVAYHKQVNGALETLLIPSAQNAELQIAARDRA